MIPYTLKQKMTCNARTSRDQKKNTNALRLIKLERTRTNRIKKKCKLFEYSFVFESKGNSARQYGQLKLSTINDMRSLICRLVPSDSLLSMRFCSFLINNRSY